MKPFNSESWREDGSTRSIITHRHQSVAVSQFLPVLPNWLSSLSFRHWPGWGKSSKWFYIT